MRLLLLDLFCGAGGASMGYHRAGFDVCGVDVAPQPNYPFPFVQADARILMGVPMLSWDRVSAIHASPPCQAFTKYKNVRPELAYIYPDLIAVMRARLEAWGKPWVMENVQGAPLVNPVTLCGSMFGLDVQRHRLFEMSHPPLMVPSCQHEWEKDRFPGGRSKQRGGHSKALVRGTVEVGTWDISLSVQQKAMGIDWMTLTELSEAIPPAYTEWIGKQIIGLCEKRAA